MEMNMKLDRLEKYNTIVIQMHDNPDADAIGSGYALYKYFQSRGKNVRLIYGGRCKITKRNICILIDQLKIPAEYLNELDVPLDVPELLLTVDCQYGEGNVQHVEAGHVAMVDHHNTGRTSDEMCEIRSDIVSCATICYDLLKAQGYDVNADRSVATALYYGLFMDSNEFSEVRHPLERDMLDFLEIDKALLNRVTHANFTLEEFETAGMAMLRYHYNENKRLAIIRAKPCDPNILGLVGDFVLQVDSIDVCIIFNELPEGYKLSVRSCIPEVTANDMAVYLVEEIGSGGGHLNKAGGFISRGRYTEKYGSLGIDTYIFSRAEAYYTSFDVVYADEGIEDTTGYALYRKLPSVIGYVKTLDFLEPGAECKIRTYEGDVTVKASEDIYVMIGMLGEVYPITREKFEQKYEAKDEVFDREFEYGPAVVDVARTQKYALLPYARQCMGKKEALVCARVLTKPVKIFSKWNYEGYMYGDAGDYICYAPGDNHDVYVVKKEIFEATYIIKKD